MTPKLFPVWIYPIFLCFLEYYEMKESIIKEVSRETHLFSLILGTTIGLII